MLGPFPLIPEILTDKIRSAIIFGDMSPNSRVVEDDIAATYQVSRSPVREALRRLAGDGLILREERRGATVAPISRRDMDEVYLCRIPLEGLVAAQAAAGRTPAQLDALDARITALEQAASTADIRAYFHANVAFTDAVHEAAANRTAKRLLDGIGKQALRYRYLAYRDFPHLIGMSVEGSHGIVDAIRAQDRAQARRLTEQLIERSWLTLRDCIPEDPA
jgi:DNA-binding GntR family transcriptional regulator